MPCPSVGAPTANEHPFEANEAAREKKIIFCWGITSSNGERAFVIRTLRTVYVSTGFARFLAEVKNMHLFSSVISAHIPIRWDVSDVPDSYCLPSPAAFPLDLSII